MQVYCSIAGTPPFFALFFEKNFENSEISRGFVRALSYLTCYNVLTEKPSVRMDMPHSRFCRVSAESDATFLLREGTDSGRKTTAMMMRPKEGSV